MKEQELSEKYGDHEVMFNGWYKNQFTFISAQLYVSFYHNYRSDIKPVMTIKEVLKEAGDYLQIMEMATTTIYERN